MEIRRGESFDFIGRRPGEKEKLLFLYTGKEVADTLLPLVFRTVLEASENGYHVILNGFYKTFYVALDAAFQMDCPIYVVVPEKLESLNLGLKRRQVLLLRGGILSPNQGGMPVDRLLLTAARQLCLELSELAIVVNARGPLIFSEALDRGVDIAVFRDSLSDNTIRLGARDGAAVIDSFSSWFELPSSFAYESHQGAFLDSRSGKRFELLKFR